MRVSESWLRSYADPPVTTAELVAQLTMAGLEVDGVYPVAGDFSGVVVGEVKTITAHPKADKLRICEVSISPKESLTIVCGAPNVVVGMKAPLALEGACLPGGMEITSAELRGVRSQGMLCSAKELGIEDGASGLMQLPADATVGADVREFLGLKDAVIEVDLTPNRADCLSVQGLAREVALLNGMEWFDPVAVPAVLTLTETFPVSVDVPFACPRYLGRLFIDFEHQAPTPFWMIERLRRSGIRSLGPIVDVTNYVLLEMGQPLHAFDTAKLTGSIQVRFGRRGEQLTLLNDRTIDLDEDVLVIADEKRPLALAGIMGGTDSAVGGGTTTVFLECAFFSPEAIMGRARRYGLSTDSSHRFERGVDPYVQERALERATELLLEIVGGKAGPIVSAIAEVELPRRSPIRLRERRLASYLGIEIALERVERILRNLGMFVESCSDGWIVTPPGFRFDVSIEVDLIEEIARVYGYNQLPKRNPVGRLQLQGCSEQEVELDRIKDLMVDRGYQEVITYSFVDAKNQAKLEPEVPGLTLINPISSDMGVMRAGLWSGLLGAALNNLNRQQARVRIFESGLRFAQSPHGIVQAKCFAGLAVGDALEEQWGSRGRRVDFFDVKADLEAILRHCGKESAVKFVPGRHPALHPGQTAELMQDDEHIGWLGMLHPQLEKEFGFDSNIFLFELDQEALFQRKVATFRPLSKFPQVRRDIALLVDHDTSASALINCISRQSSELIRDILVFDVYTGDTIGSGKKSIALGLVLQDDVETLTDSRVAQVLEAIVGALTQEFGARLRD